MWISEAAEAAGVHVETVRYYERRGLLAQPRRPINGYRHYSDEVVRVVRFIRQAQDLGFTLDEVEELMRLRGTTPRGRGRARQAAERKLLELERKMEQLRDMRATLRRLVAACQSGHEPACPILVALHAGTQTGRPNDRRPLGERSPTRTVRRLRAATRQHRRTT